MDGFIAIIKGYKLICVMSDKQSKEKMDILRAVGAKVVVCPTDVEPTDPRSYYSVSKRLAEETPNLVCKSIRQSIECYCAL
jgi:cystathionine beta-synthase